MTGRRLVLAVYIVPMLVFLMIALFASRAQEKPRVVQWIGWPITARGYSGPDPGFYGGHPPPDILFGDSVEIGLRSDGVVVWRDLRRDSTGARK